MNDLETRFTAAVQALAETLDSETGIVAVTLTREGAPTLQLVVPLRRGAAAVPEEEPRLVNKDCPECRGAGSVTEESRSPGWSRIVTHRCGTCASRVLDERAAVERRRQDDARSLVAVGPRGRLDPNDLPVIRARAEAATPGPWKLTEGHDSIGQPKELPAPDFGPTADLVSLGADSLGRKIIYGCWRNDDMADIDFERSEDEAFVAHAREDVLQLVDEIGRMRLFMSKHLFAGASATKSELDRYEAWVSIMEAHKS